MDRCLVFKNPHVGSWPGRLYQVRITGPYYRSVLQVGITQVSFASLEQHLLSYPGWYDIYRVGLGIRTAAI